MNRRFRTLTFRRAAIFCFVCVFFTLFVYLIPTSSSHDGRYMQHESSSYKLSDPLAVTNLIDHFLDTKDSSERDRLWSYLVQSWMNSFELYVNKTESVCSLSIKSTDFISRSLNRYTKRLFLDDVAIPRHLNGFGLFLNYKTTETRSNTHPIAQNVFLSSCTYLDLIILIMKVQFVLSEMNIDYFIGRNTLLGALRHHDIVPWHSIVEFNLPLNTKINFLDRISHHKFELVTQLLKNTNVDENETGLVYKVFSRDRFWPQIEIYFYQENTTHLFDLSNSKIGSLNKSDVFPLHLRPFGPILLLSIQNPHAMVSMGEVNICESLPWDYQMERKSENNQQWRMPCEQLFQVYPFIRRKYSWRQGYCEETLKTRRLPHRTLSYFRHHCQENSNKLKF